MRRDDLVAKIYTQLREENRHVSEEQVAEMLHLILREIYERVTEGRTVCIRGFGTFKPKIYQGYTNSDIFDDASREKLADSRFARMSFKPGVILRTKLK